MARSQVFERRGRVYSQLDALLGSRTRFFAAAALTNSVLGEVFKFLPEYALTDAYGLLSDAGALLEAANLRFACDLEVLNSDGGELDRSLVCQEQRLLQGFLDARVVAAGRRWPSIRGELNRLLNEQHWASLGSRWLARSREYGGILRNLRTRLGMPLDFAAESHRVHIGVAIIRYIRKNPKTTS